MGKQTKVWSTENSSPSFSLLSQHAKAWITKGYMEDLKNLHQWDILALSCIDGRFIKRTIDWVAQKTGLRLRSGSSSGVFDYRTEVGSSKAIIDSVEDRRRFFNVIDTSIKLHSVKEVWLIDHVDCGAYGGSKEHEDAEAEKEFHIGRLTEAAQIINQKYPDLIVKKIYVDWDEIERI